MVIMLCLSLVIQPKEGNNRVTQNCSKHRCFKVFCCDAATRYSILHFDRVVLVLQQSCVIEFIRVCNMTS